VERVILRRGPSTDDGSFGILEVCGKKFFTGELPWRDNLSDLSCIPGGTYLCTVTHSGRFNRDLYELKDVPGRFAVRIHPANFCGNVSRGKRTELNGCIALGLHEGVMEGQKVVSSSKIAVQEFMDMLGNQDFELEILGSA